MAQLLREHRDMPHIVGTLPHWIEGVYLITQVEADSASDGVRLVDLPPAHPLCSLRFLCQLGTLHTVPPSLRQFYSR